ncbi:MAG: glycosyltransferase family 2 protein [Eubacteriales bacterium]
MEPKVSVVIPAYNAEKYLNEAMESVCNQTLREIEIIFVDDCSTDYTYQMIQKIAREDSRIQVYHNEVRKGAAYSRNFGLDCARGKYLYFFDADDVMHLELLERAYKQLQEQQADLIEVNCYKFEQEENKYRINNYDHEYDREQNSLYDTLAIAMFVKGFDWYAATWSKIYRLQFIKDNDIIFQNLESCNDVYFTVMATFLAEKMIRMDATTDIGVYIRIHETESRISTNRQPIYIYLAYLKIYHVLQEKKQWSDVRAYYYLYAMRIFILYSKSSGDIKKIQEFNDFLYEVGLPTLMRQEVLESSSGNKEFVVVQNMWKQFHKSLPSVKECMEVTGLFFKLEYSAQYLNVWDILDLSEKSIAIWGFGVNGKILLEHLDKYHISYDYIYDQSASNHDYQEQGHMITQYKKEHNVDIILVSTAKYYNEIKELVRKIDSTCEVINVAKYVDDCIINTV